MSDADFIIMLYGQYKGIQAQNRIVKKKLDNTSKPWFDSYSVTHSYEHGEDTSFYFEDGCYKTLQAEHKRLTDEEIRSGKYYKMLIHRFRENHSDEEVQHLMTRLDDINKRIIEEARQKDIDSRKKFNTVAEIFEHLCSIVNNKKRYADFINTLPEDVLCALYDYQTDVGTYIANKGIEKNTKNGLSTAKNFLKDRKDSYYDSVLLTSEDIIKHYHNSMISWNEKTCNKIKTIESLQEILS